MKCIVLLVAYMSMICAMEKDEPFIITHIGRHGGDFRFINTSGASFIRKHDAPIEHFFDQMLDWFSDMRAHDIDIKTVRPSLCIVVPGYATHDKSQVFFSVLSSKPDAEKLIEQGFVKKVIVLNDYEAMGYSLRSLYPRADDYIQQADSSQHGSKIIIGFGNGIGSAHLVWQDSHKSYMVQPMGFCFGEIPGTDNADELSYVNYVKEKTNRPQLTWGWFLGIANTGLKTMYAYEWDRYSIHRESALKDIPAPVIAYCRTITDIIQAYRNHDKIAESAVQRYVRWCASLVRMAALSCLPSGGIILTGDMVKDYPDIFKDPYFKKEVMSAKPEVLASFIARTPIALAPVSQSEAIFHGAQTYMQNYDTD